MALDPKSMSVVTALGYVVLALWLVLVQATQKTYPGFRTWLVGAALQAGSFLLMAGAGVLPGIPAVPNAMVVASADCLHRGLRRFAGRDARLTWTDAALYLPAGAALLLDAVVGLDARTRVVVVSALVVWLLARAARFAVIELAAEDRTGARIVAAALGATALVIAVRALHVVVNPGPFQHTLLGRGPLDTSLLAVITILSMCAIGAFLLLNLRRAVTELDGALAQVRQLEGLITICMHCRRLRDDGAAWLKLEHYMAKYSNTQFSHGLCPDCEREYYPSP